MYYFIDPGIHTGWAIFDVDGHEIDVFTTHSFTETSDTIQEHFNRSVCRNIKKVIHEDFVLYPWKANDQYWSPFEEVQVIGAIRHTCRVNKIPNDKVPARNKNMGFMYMGIKEPPHTNPANHQMVAMAHGVFWLQNEGIRLPER